MVLQLAFKETMRSNLLQRPTVVWQGIEVVLILHTSLVILAFHQLMFYRIDDKHLVVQVVLAFVLCVLEILEVES